jgi:hypothetical protein
MIDNLNADLKQLLNKQGASLVGFGDISQLVKNEENDMRFGVSVGVCMTPSIVRDIEKEDKKFYES